MNCAPLVAAALDPTLETYARLRDRLVVKGALLPSSSDPVKSLRPGSGEAADLLRESEIDLRILQLRLLKARGGVLPSGTELVPVEPPGPPSGDAAPGSCPHSVPVENTSQKDG